MSSWFRTLVSPPPRTGLKLTADGKHMIGVGTYKPQFRVWELGQSSMKFERHTTCETVAFELLRDDWTMLALLQTDRAMEFHEAKGMRYRTKVPRAPRDIVYDAERSDLLISTAQDVFLLNLELGQFKEPLVTGCGVNVCKVGPRHGCMHWGWREARWNFGTGGMGASRQHCHFLILVTSLHCITWEN